jgi:hypothetical protein
MLDGDVYGDDSLVSKEITVSISLSITGGTNGIPIDRGRSMIETLHGCRIPSMPSASHLRGPVQVLWHVTVVLPG